MRRVLVTGGRSPLARAVAARLAARPGTESLVLVDDRQPEPLGAAHVASLHRNGYCAVRDAVAEHEIDTVVHCALAPDRAGTSGERREAGVIATMQIAAVASDLSGPVRTMVALSSTARYPATSGAPVIHGEDTERRRPTDGTYRASLAEAEDYLIALADQRPNLAVSILRLAELAGPGVTGPLAELLAGPMVPRLPGFDPVVQFLHVDDAVRAVEHAGERGLAGVVNVASGGSLRWSRAIRLAGRLAYWSMGPAPEPVASALRAVGFRPLPPHLVSTLRFGRVAATERFEATGFGALHTAEECVRALRL